LTALQGVLGQWVTSRVDGSTSEILALELDIKIGVLDDGLQDSDGLSTDFGSWLSASTNDWSRKLTNTVSGKNSDFVSALSVLVQTGTADLLLACHCDICL
jgi:hypothetical protein